MLNCSAWTTQQTWLFIVYERVACDKQNSWLAKSIAWTPHDFLIWQYLLNKKLKKWSDDKEKLPRKQGTWKVRRNAPISARKCQHKSSRDHVTFLEWEVQGRLWSHCPELISCRNAAFDTFIPLFDTFTMVAFECKHHAQAELQFWNIPSEGTARRWRI